MRIPAIYGGAQLLALVSILSGCDAAPSGGVPALTFGPGPDAADDTGATPLTTGADGGGDSSGDEAGIGGQDATGSDASTGETPGTSTGEATGTTGDGDANAAASSTGEADPCGDGVCDPTESCATCPVDCRCAPDPCTTAMYGDGPYCGESIGGTAETLYVCSGGATTSTIVCGLGCAQCDPFVADVCKAVAGQTDQEACA